MALATLSIDLVAKLASLEAGLDKAGRLAEKNAARIEGSFSRLKSLGSSLGVAIGAAFSVTAINTFFRTTVNGLDALNDLKDATGASIENISALEDVAARTGTSFEGMAGTLVKFNKVLSDSKPGSEAAALIKSIGLNAEQLKRIDPAEALRQVAVALSGYADDGNKARVVQELFGKSVREVAPFLSDLAKQGQLNGTVMTKQAEEAEKFNQQLSRLEKNATDAGRAVVTKLVPALNQFLDQGRAADSALERISVFLEATGFGAGLKLIGIDIFGKDQETQAENLKLALEATNKLLESGNLSEERRIRLLERRKQIEASIERAAIPQASYSNEGRTHPAPAIPAVDSPAYLKMREQLEQRAKLVRIELQTGEPLKEADKYRLEQLQAINDATSTLTATERAKLTAILGSTVAVVKLNDAQKQSMERIGAEAKALAAENQARQENTKKLNEQLEELGLNNDQLAQLTIARLEEKAALEEEKIATLALFDARAANLGLMRDNVAELRNTIQLRKDLRAEEKAQAGNPIKGASDALDAYLEKVARSAEATREAVGSSLNSLESDLTTSLKNGKLEVSSFIDTVITEFLRLQIVRPMLNSVFGGAGGGGGSGWANVLGAVFGGGSGGFTNGGSYVGGIPWAPRADGGPVSAGGTYLVGEKGPEVLRLGGMGGHVTPNHKLGGTAMHFDFSGQVINVGQGVSRGEVEAAVRLANARTEERIRRSLRQGTYS